MNTRQIKPFLEKGTCKEHEWAIKNQFMIEGYITDDMREKGYVPQLDIVPELYIEYQHEEEEFIYAVVVYGTYVGKVESQKVLGMLGPHKIYKEPFTDKAGKDASRGDGTGGSDTTS